MMKSIFNSVFLAIFLGFFTANALAAVNLDILLKDIDSDIISKRLSTPAGNNATDRIWQFKSLAPFDQRINRRVYNVGKAYISLANRSIDANQYSKAQGYLDKVWMLAYLTPGLESTQETLDKYYKGGATKSKKSTVAKVNNQNVISEKEKAARIKAAKAAKSKRLAQERRQLTEKKKRQLAQIRKKEEAKRQSNSKLAALQAKRERTAAALKIASAKEITLATFNLNQEPIGNRNTRKIRAMLAPVCQEIIDKGASVIMHTRSKLDYRWLTVRLTLCVRRLDKGFRLRHSNQLADNNEPSISLHPSRNVSLR